MGTPNDSVMEGYKCETDNFGEIRFLRSNHTFHFVLKVLRLGWDLKDSID